MHRIKASHELEQPDQDCYFRSDVVKWKEMNGTAHFSAFLVDIRPYAQSLVQILFYKKEIIDILIKHLSISDTLAYEPLLS